MSLSFVGFILQKIYPLSKQKGYFIIYGILNELLVPSSASTMFCNIHKKYFIKN